MGLRINGFSERLAVSSPLGVGEQLTARIASGGVVVDHLAVYGGRDRDWRPRRIVDPLGVAIYGAATHAERHGY